MESSIPLFSVRGITIRMHITFPLILIWGALQFGLLNQGGWPGAIFGLIVTLILFAIVVLHELGHSMAALHYGVPVKQIVLLPIGGVAELGHILRSIRVCDRYCRANGQFWPGYCPGKSGLDFRPGDGANASRELLANLGQLNFATIFSYVFVSTILGILICCRFSHGRWAGFTCPAGCNSITGSYGYRRLDWAGRPALGLYGFLNGGFSPSDRHFIFSGPAGAAC
jgi:hypothetical protein